MRIAELVRRYRPPGGGVDNVVRTEAEALRLRGHEVVILASDTAMEAQGRGPRIIPLRGRPEGALSALAHLQTISPDVIRVHGYSTWSPAVAALAGHLLGVPVVFSPFFHPEGNHPAVFRKLFDLGPGRWSLKHADRVCYLSEEERAHLCRLGASDEQLVRTLIPLDEIFFAQSDPRIFRSAFPDLSAPLLLFAGRLDWNKGLLELLEAFAILLQRHPSATLVLVGPDAGAAPALRRRARVLGVEHRVGWLGPQDQPVLLSAYAAASLFVLPSSYESFGRVLIEAMAAGLPVVATRVGGIPEVVEEGRTGLLVPFGDVAQLSQALALLLEDAALRKRFSVEGRRRAETFRVDAYGAKVEAILSQVVS